MLIYWKLIYFIHWLVLFIRKINMKLTYFIASIEFAWLSLQIELALTFSSFVFLFLRTVQEVWKSRWLSHVNLSNFFIFKASGSLYWRRRIPEKKKKSSKAKVPEWKINYESNLCILIFVLAPSVAPLMDFWGQTNAFP